MNFHMTRLTYSNDVLNGIPSAFVQRNIVMGMKINQILKAVFTLKTNKIISFENILTKRGYSSRICHFSILFPAFRRAKNMPRKSSFKFFSAVQAALFESFSAVFMLFQKTQSASLRTKNLLTNKQSIFYPTERTNA